MLLNKLEVFCWSNLVNTCHKKLSKSFLKGTFVLCNSARNCDLPEIKCIMCLSQAEMAKLFLFYLKKCSLTSCRRTGLGTQLILSVTEFGSFQTTFLSQSPVTERWGGLRAKAAPPVRISTHRWRSQPPQFNGQSKSTQASTHNRRWTPES